MEDTVIKNREVTWSVLDIPVHGTITAPKDNEVHSAVIFVAGSGPTDRDWCSPLLPGTNGSGRLLAESLARQGFVTLRYDKVASGPHTRENVSRFAGRLSVQTHVDELAGAVATLLSEKNMNRDNLFVLTSSEGAVHAVNYQLRAKNNRFEGLVLTGAPGRSIGEIARSQIARQIRSLPDADILMKQYDDAIAEFVAGIPVVIDPSLPEGIRQLVLSLESPVNLPFARELWAYRLADYIIKINEPVLVVIGKKDIQTDWKTDGMTLEHATAQKPTISFSYPENANHVLKHEETPVEQLNAQNVGLRYNAPDAKLDKEAEGIIITWLKREEKTGMSDEPA
jgi:hypothetical protein